MNQFSNILLAEDDSVDYLFFAEAVEKVCSSCKITGVTDGLQCMNFLKTAVKPDLIFLDLTMPGYTGLDCLKYIKARKNFADIPVIIYSKSHYIKNIDTCYKNEAHFYIVKPASPDNLVNILKQVFTDLSKSLQRPAKEHFVVRAESLEES